MDQLKLKFSCNCILNIAYGIVFLVRKKGGKDDGMLYAMKILKKSAIVQKVKTAEHTKTERQVRIFEETLKIKRMNNNSQSVLNSMQTLHSDDKSGIFILDFSICL